MTVSTSRMTKKEIARQRARLELLLHGGHLALGDDMDAFQRQWDADPEAAFAASAAAGWNEAGADWLDGQAALFDRAAWLELAGKVGKGAPPCGADDRVDDPDYRWEWWHTAVVDRAAPAATPPRPATAAGANLLSAAAVSQNIYRHRAAILALPTEISNDGMAAAERFLDTVLADIDAELVAAIKSDPYYPVVREIFDEHESALSYFAYVELMLEAIPPNFYACIAGKAAPYCMMEAALLVMVAPLCTGTAVQLRLTTLTKKLEAGAVAPGHDNASAQAAIASFARVLDDFSRAADDLHALGDALIRARGRDSTATGVVQRLRAWVWPSAPKRHVRP